MIPFKDRTNLPIFMNRKKYAKNEFYRRLFVELPPELLIETLGYLEPLTLLYMSQATRTLHAFLANRSAGPIWRLSFSRVEFLPPPECPPFMTPMQYARLLFENHCHHCGNKSMIIIHLTLSRLCSKCFQTHFKKANDLPRSFPLPREALRLASLNEPAMHSGSYSPTTSRDSKRTIYCLAILEELEKNFFYVSDDRQSKERWLTHLEKERKERGAVMAELQTWLDSYRTLLQSKRQKRFKDICARLQSEWAAELDVMDKASLKSRALVKKAKDLTDTEWRLIKPAVEQIMLQMRQDRLVQLHHDAVHSRRSIIVELLTTHAHNGMTPPPADVVMAEPLRTFIEQPAHNVTLTWGMLSRELQRHVVPIFCNLIHTKKLELVNIMRDSGFFEFRPELEHLDLAMTFFLCDGVEHHHMQYQDVLRNPRLIKHASDWDVLDPDTRRLFQDVGGEFFNFGGTRIRVHRHACAAAAEVVRSCGMDPATATSALMDRIAPYVECMGCLGVRGGSSSCRVMEWRRAVIHQMAHWHWQCPTSWRIVWWCASPRPADFLPLQRKCAICYLCGVVTCDEQVLHTHGVQRHPGILGAIWAPWPCEAFESPTSLSYTPSAQEVSSWIQNHTPNQRGLIPWK